MNLMVFICFGLMVLSFKVSACDKLELSKELINYTQLSRINFLKSVDVFETLANSLESDHSILESYVVNKSTMDEGSFSPLTESESRLVELTDDLYDTQEVLLEKFGEEPTEESLFGQIMGCYPELGQTLEQKLELHVSEIKLEDSNVSAIFDTLYNYSSKILMIIEGLNHWLENNKTANIPSAEQFLGIKKLSNSAVSVKECAKDLLNLTMHNLCQITKDLKINILECQSRLFPKVNDCK